MDILNVVKRVNAKARKSGNFFDCLTPRHFLIHVAPSTYNTLVPRSTRHLRPLLSLALALTIAACSRTAPPSGSEDAAAPPDAAHSTGHDDPLQPPPPPPSNAALDAIEIGDRAMLDGDFEAAIAAFRTASHETPGNPDILRSLAEALIAAGNPGEAIPAYTQILAIDPADQTTHYNLGVAHMHLGHYREAELTFQRLLQSDTDNLPALFNLAEAYREQHKLADARDTWQRCLAIDSENAEAHMRLAEAFWELRDFQAAERHFRTASTLAPDDLDTQLNFAAAARINRNYGWAALAMRRALAIDKTQPEIWNQAADVMLTIYRKDQELERLAEAVYAWEQSLELDPSQEGIRERIDTYAPLVKGIEVDAPFGP
jgi:tetratricopeptide (TPR) repeat protein